MTDSNSIHLTTNNPVSFPFMAESYSIVYMCHIFFIHSSVDGHLGCFHVLAIVNSAAMNIGVHVFFQTMFFSGYMPKSGIAGSYGSSIFSSQGTSIMFSIVATPIYIPTNSAREFPSLHTLSSIYCLWIFFSFFFFNLFIYLFLIVLGLRFCARAFSSCGERGPLFIIVRGPLTVAASPVAEHRLQTHRLSNCGSRA